MQKLVVLRQIFIAGGTFNQKVPKIEQVNVCCLTPFSTLRFPGNHFYIKHWDNGGPKRKRVKASRLFQMLILTETSNTRTQQQSTSTINIPTEKRQRQTTKEREQLDKNRSKDSKTKRKDTEHGTSCEHKRVGKQRNSRKRTTPSKKGHVTRTAETHCAVNCCFFCCSILFRWYSIAGRRCS